MIARHGRNLGHRLGQLGFLSQRAWGVLLVLCMLLIVPYWMARKTGNKTPAQPVIGSGKQASSAPNAAPSAAAGKAVATATEHAPATAAATASPDRFGLSFGHGELPSKYKDLMYSACAGAPQDMGNPDKNQCNPHQGDSSCRTALPVLCILKDASTPESAGLANEPKTENVPNPEGAPKGPDVYAAWVGGTLAATAPVAGFVIGSLAQANARCTSELGSGWRMAEFRDAGAGEGLVGKRGQGLGFTHTRHWVAAKDHRSHCWDPP